MINPTNTNITKTTQDCEHSYFFQEFINLLNPNSAPLLEDEFESGRLSPDTLVDRIQKIAKSVNLKKSDRKKLDKKIAEYRDRMKKMEESLPTKAERKKVKDKYFETPDEALISSDGNKKAEKIKFFHFAHKALEKGDQKKAIENVKQCPAILEGRGPWNEILLHFALLLKCWKFVERLDKFWTSQHLSAKDNYGDTPMDLLRKYSDEGCEKVTQILEKLKDRVS